MHTKLFVALFAALALTACQKTGDSMEAAGNAMSDVAQEACHAVSDTAAEGAEKSNTRPKIPRTR